MHIVVADHHPQSRWAVKTLLDEEPEFDLAGEAEDVNGLMALAEKCPVDLILIDRDLPGLPIEETIARLRALQPPPVIIVVSSDVDYEGSLAPAGANAFVSKANNPGLLVEKLHEYARIN